MNFPLILAAILALGSSARAEDTSRFVRETNLADGTVLLQTCVRHYRAAHKPEVVLVAAMHVGETNYYATLQRELDARPLVMFEGVGWAEAKERGMDPAKHRRDASAKQSATSDLQTELAELLGGKFQLDAIDYDRTNFVNNDMSISQLQARLKGQPMDGDAFFGMMGLYAAIMKPVMALVQASPSLRATVKVLMMDVLAEAGNDVESITRSVPSMQSLFKVILRDRNDLIFSNLQAQVQLKRPPASVAMFYGAAHMPGLAKRLESELHYQAAGEQWLTVLSVNPEREKVDATMLSYLRGMFREALAQAREPSTPPETNAVPAVKP